MTKYWLVYIFIMVASCEHKENKITCDKFRTGKFSYHGYIIERNDSIQVEKDETRGIRITKKINWINSCEYELTFLSARQKDTLPGGKLSVYERKEMVQKFTIVETAKDFYVFEGLNSKGEIVRDKVWFIRMGGFKSIGDVFPVKK